MNAYLKEALVALDDALVSMNPFNEIGEARRQILLAIRELRIIPDLPEIEPIEGPTRRQPVGGHWPGQQANTFAEGKPKRKYTKKVKSKYVTETEQLRATGGRVEDPKKVGPRNALIAVMGGETFAHHVECPKCGAKPGFACVVMRGKTKGQFTTDRHDERIALARQINAAKADIKQAGAAVGDIREAQARWFPEQVNSGAA